MPNIVILHEGMKKISQTSFRSISGHVETHGTQYLLSKILFPQLFARSILMRARGCTPGMKKFVFIAIAVVLVGALGYQVYKRSGKSEGNPRQSQSAQVAVVTAPVERMMMKEVSEFSGSLKPSAQFLISPKIGGRLEKLHADVGDTVHRGDLIAELDGEEAALQVEQARAELEVSKATLEDSKNGLSLAQREYERARVLWEKQIASVSELEQAEAQLRAGEVKSRVALAQVREKEAALRAAEIRLSYTKIRAVWSNGSDSRVIGERFVEEGALLKANDPVVTVLDIEPLTAVVNVIERDYPRIRQGQAAVVTTELFHGREFNARVVRISPLLNATVRQGEIQLEVPNPGLVLKPGMFVRVEIEFSRKEGATTVPVSALVGRNGAQGVFLVDSSGQRVAFVPVQVGIVYEGHAEIVTPSISGEVVVLGHHLLEDGSAVKVSGKDQTSASGQTAGPDDGSRRE